MTTIIIVAASAALVYLVGLPLVKMIHDERAREDHHD